MYSLLFQQCHMPVGLWDASTDGGKIQEKVARMEAKKWLLQYQQHFTSQFPFGDMQRTIMSGLETDKFKEDWKLAFNALESFLTKQYGPLKVGGSARHAREGGVKVDDNQYKGWDNVKMSILLNQAMKTLAPIIGISDEEQGEFEKTINKFYDKTFGADPGNRFAKEGLSKEAFVPKSTAIALCDSICKAYSFIKNAKEKAKKEPNSLFAETFNKMGLSFAKLFEPYTEVSDSDPLKRFDAQKGIVDDISCADGIVRICPDNLERTRCELIPGFEAYVVQSHNEFIEEESRKARQGWFGEGVKSRKIRDDPTHISSAVEYFLGYDRRDNGALNFISYIKNGVKGYEQDLARRYKAFMEQRRDEYLPEFVGSLFDIPSGNINDSLLKSRYLPIRSDGILDYDNSYTNFFLNPKKLFFEVCGSCNINKPSDLRGYKKADEIQLFVDLDKTPLVDSEDEEKSILRIVDAAKKLGKGVIAVDFGQVGVVPQEFLRRHVPEVASAKHLAEAFVVDKDKYKFGRGKETRDLLNKLISKCEDRGLKFNVVAGRDECGNVLKFLKAGGVRTDSKAFGVVTNIDKQSPALIFTDRREALELPISACRLPHKEGLRSFSMDNLPKLADAVEALRNPPKSYREFYNAMAGWGSADYFENDLTKPVTLQGLVRRGLCLNDLKGFGKEGYLSYVLPYGKYVLPRNDVWNFNEEIYDANMAKDAELLILIAEFIKNSRKKDLKNGDKGLVDFFSNPKDFYGERFFKGLTALTECVRKEVKGDNDEIKKLQGNFLKEAEMYADGISRLPKDMLKQLVQKIGGQEIFNQSIGAFCVACGKPIDVKALAADNPVVKQSSSATGNVSSVFLAAPQTFNSLKERQSRLYFLNDSSGKKTETPATIENLISQNRFLNEKYERGEHFIWGIVPSSSGLGWSYREDDLIYLDIVFNNKAMNLYNELLKIAIKEVEDDKKWLSVQKSITDLGKAFQCFYRMQLRISDLNRQGEDHKKFTELLTHFTKVAIARGVDFVQEGRGKELDSLCFLLGIDRVAVAPPSVSGGSIGIGAPSCVAGVQDTGDFAGAIPKKKTRQDVVAMHPLSLDLARPPVGFEKSHEYLELVLKEDESKDLDRPFRTTASPMMSGLHKNTSPMFNERVKTLFAQIVFSLFQEQQYNEKLDIQDWAKIERLHGLSRHNPSGKLDKNKVFSLIKYGVHNHKLYTNAESVFGKCDFNLTSALKNNNVLKDLRVTKIGGKIEIVMDGVDEKLQEPITSWLRNHSVNIVKDGKCLMMKFAPSEFEGFLKEIYSARALIQGLTVLDKNGNILVGKTNHGICMPGGSNLSRWNPKTSAIAELFIEANVLVPNSDGMTEGVDEFSGAHIFTVPYGKYDSTLPIIMDTREFLSKEGSFVSIKKLGDLLKEGKLKDAATSNIITYLKLARQSIQDQLSGYCVTIKMAPNKPDFGDIVIDGDDCSRLYKAICGDGVVLSKDKKTITASCNPQLLMDKLNIRWKESLSLQALDASRSLSSEKSATPVLARGSTKLTAVRGVGFEVRFVDEDKEMRKSGYSITESLVHDHLYDVRPHGSNDVFYAYRATNGRFLIVGKEAPVELRDFGAIEGARNWNSQIAGFFMPGEFPASLLKTGDALYGRNRPSFSFSVDVEPEAISACSSKDMYIMCYNADGDVAPRALLQEYLTSIGRQARDVINIKEYNISGVQYQRWLSKHVGGQSKYRAGEGPDLQTFYRNPYELIEDQAPQRTGALPHNEILVSYTNNKNPITLILPHRDDNLQESEKDLDRALALKEFLSLTLSGNSVSIARYNDEQFKKDGRHIFTNVLQQGKDKKKDVTGSGISEVMSPFKVQSALDLKLQKNLTSGIGLMPNAPAHSFNAQLEKGSREMEAKNALKKNDMYGKSAESIGIVSVNTDEELNILRQKIAKEVDDDKFLYSIKQMVNYPEHENDKGFLMPVLATIKEEGVYDKGSYQAMPAFKNIEPHFYVCLFNEEFRRDGDKNNKWDYKKIAKNFCNLNSQVVLTFADALKASQERSGMDEFLYNRETLQYLLAASDLQVIEKEEITERELKAFSDSLMAALFGNVANSVADEKITTLLDYAKDAYKFYLASSLSTEKKKLLNENDFIIGFGKMAFVLNSALWAEGEKKNLHLDVHNFRRPGLFYMATSPTSCEYYNMLCNEEVASRSKLGVESDSNDFSLPEPSYSPPSLPASFVSVSNNVSPPEIPKRREIINPVRFEKDGGRTQENEFNATSKIPSMVKIGTAKNVDTSATDLSIKGNVGSSETKIFSGAMSKKVGGSSERLGKSKTETLQKDVRGYRI